MELKIIGVSKIIGEKTILKDVNFSLHKGDSMALRGVNGSGKTTLLKIIAGLDKNYSGEVKFAEKREKGSIGYVPQDIVLFEDLNVKDNLMIFGSPGKIKGEIKRRVDFYADALSLTGLLKKRVSELSGGQKRLVNITAGIINFPKLILLDEAIVGLDTDALNKMEGLINRIKDDRIIIITSHQEDFLRNTCNIFGKIEAGGFRIEENG